MTTLDPRVRPLVSLEPATIARMVAPVTGGGALGDITPVDGGLVNTLFRVTTRTGDRFALRVFAQTSRETQLIIERRLLDGLRDILPVPVPILIDERGTRCGYPYLVYRWIEGITLNECRRAHGADALASLAEPIGRLAATIASGLSATHGVALARLGVADAIARADADLAAPRVRGRLGATSADALRSTLREVLPALAAIEQPVGLVHGDFGGRNVLVRQNHDGRWAVSGVIDWETAAAGSPLWDIGSLFRYAPRYSPGFRDGFEHGYRAASAWLPDEWWTLARVLDVTRVVKTLTDDRELPSVFEDCRAIVDQLSGHSLTA